MKFMIKYLCSLKKKTHPKVIYLEWTGHFLKYAVGRVGAYLINNQEKQLQTVHCRPCSGFLINNAPLFITFKYTSSSNGLVNTWFI